MGKFHENAEFESRFEKMDLEELQRWHTYWMRYAQQLPPNARRWGMSRVYEVERAIRQKGGEIPDQVPIVSSAETPARKSLSASPTKKAKALAGRIMYIERKAGSLIGSGRIGRVTRSKTG